MMQTKPFQIGTRGSPLALYQAHEVRSLLMKAHDLPETAFEIVVLSTKGDRITNQALSEIGGKGLFTLELEEKLADGSLDFAVHSSKDMATTLPDDMHISCFLEREDARDAFIGGAAPTIANLPENALIGSSSLRRQALLKRMRPDLRVTLFRGLVETRLRKLDEGQVDATLLAYAGMKRLGIEARATELLDINDFLTAPGQGAICVETRIGDDKIDHLLAPINHAKTQIALLCERAFLRALDGSCKTPIAGFAKLHDDKIQFSGMILTPDGTTMYDIKCDGLASNAELMGKSAGEKLKSQAGTSFFASWT
jgi:hydroxymethylbilane synthase